MTNKVYKIFRPAEWEAFKATAIYNGSEHDRRDGFIHLCSFEQLGGTIAKHYSDVPEVILAAFLETDLQDLKWEVSRGGDKFPHLYADLHFSSLADYKTYSTQKEA
ncbi:MAG: DUF952 domain-containing protein [Methylococcales bacterium]|nr:DUF952 domain-containing protein [Methylococcales bacterium]